MLGCWKQIFLFHHPSGVSPIEGRNDNCCIIIKVNAFLAKMNKTKLHCALTGYFGCVVCCNVDECELECEVVSRGNGQIITWPVSCNAQISTKNRNKEINDY